MIPHVIEAKYKKGFCIWLRFDDGSEGVVDLENELTGEMFEPLMQLDKFRLFHVDPELETIVWENGADMAPEFLHEKANSLNHTPNRDRGAPSTRAQRRPSNTTGQAGPHPAVPND